MVNRAETWFERAREHVLYKLVQRLLWWLDVLESALSRARLGHEAAIERSEANAGSHLLVTHGRGGGVDRHVADEIERLKASNITVYVLRFHSLTRQFVLHAGTKSRTALGRFTSAWGIPDLLKTLRSLNVRHVHVHHLRLYPWHFVRSFPQFALQLGTRYDVVLHDFMPVCPRIHAVDGSGRFCGLPEDPSICNECVKRCGTLTVAPPDVGAWREAYRGILAGASAVRAPSSDTRRRFGKIWVGLPISVAPHLGSDRPPGRAFAPRGDRSGSQVRVSIVGNIHRVKGADVLVSCARDAERRRLALRFTVIGTCSYLRTLEGLGVTVTGRYHAAVLSDALERADTQVVWLPSVWPETYSYVLSEIWGAGYYPIVFDLGAPAERIRRTGAGKVLPVEWIDRPQLINDYLLSI